MKIEPLYVTVEETARLLSISRSKCYELVAKDEIPYVRFGSSIRVPVAALRAVMEQSNPSERDGAES